jgi:hypothetical protein
MLDRPTASDGAEGRSSGLVHRTFVAGTLVLAALATTWPYLSSLGYGPMTTDDALWIVNGSIDRPGWLEWDLRSAHLAGYRPVAALSFTLDSWISGLHPWSYRATHLVLHLAVALLIPLLYRRLAPDLPRWGAGVACALYLLHPLVEFSVPYLARRSYLLGTLFSLAAMCVLLGGGKHLASWTRRLCSGALLALALLSNETAFVSAGVMPFMRRDRADRRRGRVASAVRELAVPAGVAGAALALRFALLGGLGGYVDPSEVRGGRLTAVLTLPAGLAYYAGDQRSMANSTVPIALDRAVEAPPGRAVYVHVGGDASWDLTRIR